MTHLRQQMLDELQRRNYSQSTVRSYIYAVEDFAKYFHRSPERLGPDHIRQYQAYLFRERKLSAGTIEGRTAALRFLFVKTLRRPYLPDHIPFPKRQRRLPTILDQQEVARLIECGQQPDASHHADDAVRNRSAPGRDVPPQESPISTASAWSFMSDRARAAATVTCC